MEHISIYLHEISARLKNYISKEREYTDKYEIHRAGEDKRKRNYYREQIDKITKEIDSKQLPLIQ
jgi:hypothetical protein